MMLHRLLLILMAGGILCTGFPLSIAHAQLLDDKANMKVLRAKSNMLRINPRTLEKHTPHNALEASPQNVTACGAVDIGNQYTDSNRTGDISVVIVGDIVNTGNVCRGF